jgi:hypothetical protein
MGRIAILGINQRGSVTVAQEVTGSPTRHHDTKREFFA